MSQTRELLDTFAVSFRPQVSSQQLAAVIDAMAACEEAVTACAAAMVAEDDVQALQDAIVRDLNCADVVTAVRRMISRGGDITLMGTLLEACVMACEHSAELCAKHAHHHDHCRICSEATLRCAQACREVLRGLHG
ncbi:four-helix bundle copper-binding protein [Dactylosporangium sp. AC04546]|uniref:four-helix bundle copper-binding protein n=1 Tax=Dactylosporangium sp. AC04546 TaxID=2862460 RepID=UPI001EDF716B|nr:four-helix bundle copper-binding protein [Dactylosporangium sp. AC04546]WVK80391.1 four-helix bundle copper-binding protein [Dactylosporangium sp. AC04546]